MKKILSDTRLAVKLILPIFVMFFLVNAGTGFFALSRLSQIYDDGVGSLETVRSAQVHLDQQIITWQKVLLNAHEPEIYRKYFHDFSYCAQDTQNALLNLKLQLSEVPEFSAESEQIIRLHEELTSDYTQYITGMDETSGIDYKADASIAKGRDREILDRMNALGKAIDSHQSESISFSRRSFARSALLICAALVSLMVLFGYAVGRRLVQSHALLEAEVRKRTSALVEANNSLKTEISDRLRAEADLIAARNDLEETNRLIAASEKKYRTLIEGTEELIFTLDSSFVFTSVNGSAKTALRISPQKLTGMRLFDLIHEGSDGASVSGAIIAESLERCRVERRPFHFNAALKTSGLIEPVNFDVTVEFIGEGGLEEIMGRAVPATGNRINGCCTFEKGRYEIDSQLIDAEETSYRVTEKLSNFLPASDVTLMKMGVREMIINAIEHGNLGVSFEEKTAALDQGCYFQLINERQENPANRGRKVVIDYLVAENHAVFRITDRGNGFDHRKMIERSVLENESGELAHGRGITLVRSIFDRVVFNEKGNQILLEKKF
jgi:PAS domain S-box-containing protein